MKRYGPTEGRANELLGHAGQGPALQNRNRHRRAGCAGGAADLAGHRPVAVCGLCVCGLSGAFGAGHPLRRQPRRQPRFQARVDGPDRGAARRGRGDLPVRAFAAWHAADPPAHRRVGGGGCRGSPAGRKRRRSRARAVGRRGRHRLSGKARLSGVHQYRLHLLPPRG